MSAFIIRPAGPRDRAWYHRLGYAHDRASGFESGWQGDALLALAFGDAPKTGRLAYADAFASL